MNKATAIARANNIGGGHLMDLDWINETEPKPSARTPYWSDGAIRDYWTGQPLFETFSRYPVLVALDGVMSDLLYTWIGNNGERNWGAA